MIPKIQQPGGYFSKEITQQHKDFLTNHLAEINASLGINATQFHINAVWHQVVAGTNILMHLTCNNGNKYTVIIYKHFHNPPQVTRTEKGHI